MLSSHLLSVGYDKHLMHTRGMVLRKAGFIVDETFNVKAALALVRSDSIDGMILCHTVPKAEQRWLIAGVREIRKLLPIVYVSDLEVFKPEEGCIGTTNDPSQLVRVVMNAIQIWRNSIVA